MYAQNQTNSSNAKPLINIAALIGAWIIARILYALLNTQVIEADLKIIPPLLSVDDVANQKSENAIVNNLASSLTDKLSIGFANVKERDILFTPKNDEYSNKFSVSSGGSVPKDFYPLLFLAGIEEGSSALLQESKPSFIPSFNTELPVDIMNGHKNHNKLPPAFSGENLDGGLEGALNGASNGGFGRNLASRLSAYGYIFARSGSGPANALGARYGGSQAAFQAAYRINPNKKTIWDVSFRAQSAFNNDDFNDQEIAAGLRVQPHEKLPVSIIAERRLRTNSADGFAFYAAGGKSALPLAAKFKLDIYGQAGISTAGPDTLFFDGSAQILRPIHSNDKITIAAGAGAWTGGQSGNQTLGQNSAQRLDIGPSLSIKLLSGQKHIRNFRLSGDWRERVAGNAAPNSGAAITLSADF